MIIHSLKGKVWSSRLIFKVFHKSGSSHIHPNIYVNPPNKTYSISSGRGHRGPTKCLAHFCLQVLVCGISHLECPASVSLPTQILLSLSFHFLTHPVFFSLSYSPHPLKVKPTFQLIHEAFPHNSTEQWILHNQMPHGIEYSLSP